MAKPKTKPTSKPAAKPKPATKAKPVAKTKSATTKARSAPTSAKPKSAEKAKPEPTPKPTAAADSLLAQVLAAPDDPSLRLVYADVLIEAGDPRGTFIAQQSSLADLDPLDERYAPMLASTHRLLSTHGQAWLDGYELRVKLTMVGREPVGRLSNAVFRGGFLQRIAMGLDDIAREWNRLRAREPIEGVELAVGEHVDPQYRHLTEPAEFRTLRIRPDGWFTSNSVGNVLAWGMPHLRALDLTGCDLGNGDGARLLANLDTDLAEFEGYVDPPHFADGQLVELVLDSCQIRDDGARLLFDAPHLSALTTLDLARCRIVDPATLEALRAAPAMRALRRLSLAGNNDLGPGLGALAGWEVVPRLERLALPQSTTAEALAALFPEPSAALRALALTSAKQLVQSSGWLDAAVTFVELDLGTTSLGDERWAQLVTAPSVRRLVHLRANGCSLSDAAIDALVASPLDRLVTLDLSSNKLTDDGLRRLAAWDGLQHVTHLRLGNNRKLTAKGLAALADAPKFQPAELDVGKLDGAPLRERFGDVLVTG